MNHSPPHRLVAGGCGLVPGSVCPACGHGIAPDEKWCPSCDFTANRAIEWFQDAPPPLVSLFDAAAIWSDTDLESIKASAKGFRKKFPQFVSPQDQSTNSTQ